MRFENSTLHNFLIVDGQALPYVQGYRELADEGETRGNIARLTGFSCPTITFWCQSFQARRLEGLVDEPGHGRKSWRAALEMSEHGEGSRYFLDQSCLGIRRN
ncbi:hypothetical protein B1F73_04420 [Pseudomonas syringae]|nr:hypothetical protein B1F73_04420 [Pseudomonas syringae]RXU21008.1 hypothetical protein B0A92_24055 [Pseudomonas syringae]